MRGLVLWSPIPSAQKLKIRSSSSFWALKNPEESVFNIVTIHAYTTANANFCPTLKMGHLGNNFERATMIGLIWKQSGSMLKHSGTFSNMVLFKGGRKHWSLRLMQTWLVVPTQPLVCLMEQVHWVLFCTILTTQCKRSAWNKYSLSYYQWSCST